MRARVVWAVVLVTVGAIGAASCGTPAPGAGTAFCSDAVSLAAGLRSSGSSSEVSFLTIHEATIEDLEAKAPRAIKRDVRTFSTGANDAITQNDAALANTPSTDAASGRIKAYCGITG